MKKISVILISLVMLVVAAFPATAAQVPAETTTQAYTTAPTEYTFDLSAYEGTTDNVTLFDIDMSDTINYYNYSVVYSPSEHTMKLYKRGTTELAGLGGFISTAAIQVAYAGRCTFVAQEKKFSFYCDSVKSDFISISDVDNYRLTYGNFYVTPVQPTEETTSAAPIVEQTTAPAVEQTTAPVDGQNKDNSFADKLIENSLTIIIVLAVLVVLLLAACIVLVLLLLNAKNSNVTASNENAAERKTSVAAKTNQAKDKKSGTTNKVANTKVKNAPKISENKKSAVIDEPEAVSVVKEVEAPAPEVIVPVKTFVETAKESLAVAYQSGSLPSISHKFAQIESYMTKLSGKPIIKEYDGSQSYFIFFSDPETGKMYLLPNPNYYNEKKCSFLLTKPGISDFIGVTGAENNGIIIGTVPSEIIKEGQDTYVVVKKGLIAWQ